MKMVNDIEIKGKVLIAINTLFRNDIFLLRVGANERSVSHKLAEYLQQLFPDWNVDCEYNRNELNHKRLKDLDVCDYSDKDEDGNLVYPDIIIHKRRQKKNLLVIEIKTAKNYKKDCDIEKLKVFTKDKDFEYRLGLFIGFNGISKEPEIVWVKNRIEEK